MFGVGRRIAVRRGEYNISCSSYSPLVFLLGGERRRRSDKRVKQLTWGEDFEVVGVGRRITVGRGGVK